MVDSRENTWIAERPPEKSKRRLGANERRIQQLEGEVKDLRKEVWKLQKEQARLLGFLEGRGIMG
ncbi:MAG: hypothetical protein OXG23_00055 [Chloroflexi bacterium]|nr:hypothetical protein [Chloroflexota bacterium]